MKMIGPMIYEFEKALPEIVCNEIVSKFSLDKRKTRGETAGGYNPEMKKSNDLHISGYEDWKYFDDMVCTSAAMIINAVGEKHNALVSAPLKDNGYRIQHSIKGDYFKAHNDGGFYDSDIWMTIIWYLNTNNAGTRFPELGVDVKCEIGKAIAYPAFWSHVHEGYAPYEGDKFIMNTFVTLNRELNT